MSTVLVTGAGGFVGRHLVARLQSDGHRVRGVVHRPAGSDPAGLDAWVPVGLPDVEPLQPVLSGVDVVVHLAARAHLVRDRSADPAAAFQAVNTEGTLRLARLAAMAGVRRFVFTSTVKVLGDGTAPGQPWHLDSPMDPQDPYARSKADAESGLRQLQAETGMEVVVVRLPLVHGPGVRGNFPALVRWVEAGVPLPLGAVRANRRSVLGVDNLVDLLALCLDHPAACLHPWMPTDGTDVSTAGLLQAVGLALGRPARLWPLPPACLRVAAQLVGRPGVFQNLCGSMQVDGSDVHKHLHWTPPVGLDEGLRRAVAHLEVLP